MTGLWFQHLSSCSLPNKILPRRMLRRLKPNCFFFPSLFHRRIFFSHRQKQFAMKRILFLLQGGDEISSKLFCNLFSNYLSHSEAEVFLLIDLTCDKYSARIHWSEREERKRRTNTNKHVIIHHSPPSHVFRLPSTQSQSFSSRHL